MKDPDDDRAPRRAPHVIGQDLALLSVEEIEERIALLRNEILRLEADCRAKSKSRSAAEALFRR